MSDVRDVRSGEELDLEKLSAYLAGHGITGELRQRQFGGGYSNLTYLLEVGDQPYVLRRPPRGANIRSAHDMGREYRLLTALHPGGHPLACPSRGKPTYDKVPRPVLLCEDDSVLGAPFYLMERVEGTILRGAKGPPPEVMAPLSAQLVDLLIDLHRVDYTAAGLADLGKPDGYVARQVSGWSERWRKAETEPSDVAARAIAWLEQNQPPESGKPTLIHNDFKYDNLVLDPSDLTRVRAVLDWEMATIGDPLMDLGTTLGYWVDPTDPPELRALGFGPTFLPGNLTRAQIVERYASVTGRDLSNARFYYAFGLFKIAVIAQQIYARFRKGLTTDPRFAHLDRAVNLLLSRSVEASL